VSVTSHDVARLAGVSQPTVSRALRDDPRVSQSTRRKVLEAAHVLGYVPSELGRSLSTRVSRQIAMVADIDNALYPVLVRPIHDALAEQGYRMVVVAEQGDEASAYERLFDRSADAAILTTTALSSSLPLELHRRGIPLVMLNRVSDVLEVDSVTADNHGGALAATRLLVSLGHRDIGALLGPEVTSTGRERQRGFRDALGEAGLPLRTEWVRRGWFDHAAGRAGLESIMEASPRPTALFCAGDSLAIGALNGARALGLRVPEDVAIVGFDDIEMAAWPCFELTTVRVPLADMARAAVRLLVDRLRGDGSTTYRHEQMPTELVLRATHGSPVREPAHDAS
jgi:LacI family transcriptional regulator